MHNDTEEVISKIDPKIDLAFKYIIRNEEISLALINDFFLEANLNPLREIHIIGGELSKARLKERGATLDFYGIDSQRRNINLEMQVGHHGGFEERLMFHWSKMHISQFIKGKDYSSQIIAPSVVIAITNFQFLKGESNAFNSYEMLNKNNFNAMPRKLIQLISLELPKFSDKFINQSWAPWAALFINDKKYETLVKGNTMTTQALSQLSNVSMDSDLYTAYLDHLALLNDEEAKIISTRSEAKLEGIEEGIQKGIEKGIEKGLEQRNIELVKNMTSKGFSQGEIAKILNLNIEEITNIMRLK